MSNAETADVAVNAALAEKHRVLPTSRSKPQAKGHRN